MAIEIDSPISSPSDDERVVKLHYPDLEQSKTQQNAHKNYEDAVVNGFYQRAVDGLYGKFDNVRRYWENQITRYALQDFIEPLVSQKKHDLARIRILDLGAGSGEGYEILTNLKKVSQTLSSKEVDVLPSEIIGFYKGIDICQAMVDQGVKTYAADPKVRFEVGDLSKGLGQIKDDLPYDVYYSAYGSLAHLDDEELDSLIDDICDHFKGKCIFVADVIGRYSFEWQCYWDKPGTDETNMRQYSMSYLYPTEMLDKIEVQRFPIRYWGAKEFNKFITRVVESKGARISRKKLWDRSILVGRHMNTGEFNPYAQPIRGAVNSLHEFNKRTDWRTLLFDYTPHSDFPRLNEFFERFQMAWNSVVYEAIEALEHWDDIKWLKKPCNKNYPPQVRKAVNTIRNVFRHVQWFRMGDPHANIIEQQLGYILRNLEMDLQEGIGAGHGLLAIYEIEKD